MYNMSRSGNVLIDSKAVWEEGHEASSRSAQQENMRLEAGTLHLEMKAEERHFSSFGSSVGHQVYLQSMLSTGSTHRDFQNIRWIPSLGSHSYGNKRND